MKQIATQWVNQYVPFSEIPGVDFGGTNKSPFLVGVYSHTPHLTGQAVVCGIYKITSPSGKIYIGQSINILKRWGDYKCLHNCSEQCRLYNSFVKYGVKKHSFEIIHVCETGNLNSLEEYYVGLFDSLTKGLNIRPAGGHKKHSIEKETTGFFGNQKKNVRK